MHKTHRNQLVWISLSIVLSTGCARRYVLRPESGGAVGHASSAGITIYADPVAWDAEPYDLTEVVTPIAVRLINRSGQDVAVDYSAFELVDQRGFRYATLHPFARRGDLRARPPGATQPPSAPADPEPPGPDPYGPEPEQPTSPDDQGQDDDAPGDESDHDAILWPNNDSSGRQGIQLVGFVAGTADLPGASDESIRSSAGAATAGEGTSRALLARRVIRTRRGGGAGRVYRGSRRGRAFHVYPRHRRRRRGLVVRGRAYAPWPVYVGPAYPLYPYYPHYYTHVHIWDGPHYPPASSSVRERALPEGVIGAGGEVSGFVYFQRAPVRADRLEILWHARTPRGREITTLRIPFVIVPL